MLAAAALLMACELTAGFLVTRGHLPLSTPVLGMFLLLLLLARMGETPAGMRQLTGWLLRWLTLLFVPAGVGVMLYLEPLRHQWLMLLITLLLSTVIAMAFTGWLLQRLLPPAGGSNLTVKRND